MYSNQEKGQNQIPFSLINYEAQIQISDNIEQYKKAQNLAKKLDFNPSPQDVLNNMIPPRDWKTQDNKYFMQYVSHSKSSRDDVFTLKQNLQQALSHRQARKQGICSIREQLFSQAFDQIIRQVTINCPQRGLLLMRVKDEHKMTLAAYQTLYKSSTQYGMKKQLQSQQGIPQLQMQLQHAQKKFKQFQCKKIQLECKKQLLQKKIQQRNKVDDQQRGDQSIEVSNKFRNLQAFLNSVKLDRQSKMNISKQSNKDANTNNQNKPTQQKNQ